MRSEACVPALAVAAVLAGCGDAEPAGTASGGGGRTSSSAETSVSTASGSSGSGGSDALCPSKPEGRRVVEIDMLNHGGVALLSDGTLWCWGSGTHIVCPVEGAPRQLTEYPCISSMRAADRQLIAATTEGEVWVANEESGGLPRRVSDGPATWVAEGGQFVAWGDGSSAWWWGDGEWVEDPPLEPSPFPWGPIDGLSLGGGHFCFWCEGALSCSGWNDFGQLGDGTTEQEPVFNVVAVELPIPVRVAVAGVERTYVVDETGGLWTWGRDRFLGIEPSGPTPVHWEEVGSVGGVAPGLEAACAWRSEGEVSCWGFNTYGVILSDGTVPLPGRIPPLRRPDFEPALLVDSWGDSPLCALKTDGTVWCRGAYASGADTIPDDDHANLIRFEDPWHP